MAVSGAGAPAEPVMDLAPQRGPGRITAALRDIGAGLALWRLGLALGWLDIKLRYRGSILGPLWLTISTAVMVGAMGVLYATLFHMDLHKFLPFLSLSLVLWGFIGGVVNDAPTVFTQAAPLVLSIRMPLFVHVLRMVVRNVLVLLHNVIVIVVVFALYGTRPHETLTIAPVLALWLLDAGAIALLFGTLGARFRDIGPIVASLMQIFFFVTPIIWPPEMIFVGRQYMLLNPFFPVLEILRGPLLGESVRASIWLAAGVHSVVLWALALGLFCRMRARIAYWI